MALSAVADGRAWRRFSVLSGELGLRVWPAPMVPLVSPGGRCPPRAWEERGLCEPGAHCQPLPPPHGSWERPPRPPALSGAAVPPGSPAWQRASP